MTTNANGGPSQQEAQGPAAGGRAPQQQQDVKIDTSHMKSSYCNVCNASSTREEVVLNFGINQTWDQQQSAFSVELHHRIILSPFAAKRLHEVLGKLIAEHESRHGELR